MTEKRIRILHIAEAAGGIDRYLKSLFKYMDRSKFENILICSQNYKPNDYIELADEIIQINMAHSLKPSAQLRTIKELRKKIKQIKPDFIYCHSSVAGGTGRLAAIGTSSKVIYNPHGWAFNMEISKEKKAVYILLERLLAHSTDNIICISEAERISAKQKKITNSKKLVVINNGIDLERFNSCQMKKRSDLNIPDQAFLIGMTGRICKQKGTDIFVKAAAEIKKAIPEAYFLLIGDATPSDLTMKTQIEMLIKKYNLENCLQITGWIDQPETVEPLLDVGLLLSRWEGFGLVLPEYMISGVPVVATKTDAIPFIVNDYQNGLLVPVEDVQAVVEKVLEIHTSPSLRERIINRAKEEAANNYNAHQMAERLEKELLKII